MLVILSYLRRLINPSCLKGVDSQADNKNIWQDAFHLRAMHASVDIVWELSWHLS